MCFGSIYLMLITLFSTAGWGHGVYRSLALLATLALALTAAIVSHWPESVTVRQVYKILPRFALAVGLVPISVGLLSIDTAQHVRAFECLVVGCVIIAGLLRACTQDLRDRPKLQYAATLILLASLLIPLVNILSGMVAPKLLDIATTTADAARAMMSGINPYNLNIDAAGANLVGDTAYGGYKYLPAMSGLYAPFVLLGGDKGIIFANAILYASTAIAIFYLCRKLTDQAGYLGIILFLSSPVISEQTLAMGATDIAPVLLILLAFFQWERSSFLVGLFIGLSLAMKPVPALFAATLLIPLKREERWRYALGIVCGAMPVVPYVIWSPQSFFKNVLLFNVIRPADSTSWRYYAPSWAGYIATIGSMTAWVAFSVWCSVARTSLRARLYAFVFVILGILLAAPNSHDNYAIWWAPVLVSLLMTVGGGTGAPVVPREDIPNIGETHRLARF